MMSYLRPSFFLMILLAIITGLIYPLLTTELAKVMFSKQANGSLIILDDHVVGSALIGQHFTRPEYFSSRPSATIDEPYNAMASGGSNLPVINLALDQAISERVVALRLANPTQSTRIPVDLVTASGSGLDPHISLEAAYYQAPRVANERQMPLSQVWQLINKNIHRATPNFLGESVVNVLTLNMMLDNNMPQNNKSPDKS